MNMQKKQAHRQQTTGVGVHITISLLCGAAAFMLLFAMFAFVMCKVDVSSTMLPTLAMVGACGAVMGAAYLFARLRKERGLLYGAALGIMAFLVLWGVAALQGSGVLSGLAAIKLLGMVCSGALGGHLGVWSAEKARKKRR